MSANLDLVKSIYADWEKGDFSSNDWADPGIELVVADGPSPGRVKGLQEMATLWGEVLRVYADFRAVAEEYRELDDERVLVLIRNLGRGRVSGLEVADVEPRSANLFHLRDGKVTRLTAWWSRDRALTELGI